MTKKERQSKNAIALILVFGLLTCAAIVFTILVIRFRKTKENKNGADRKIHIQNTINFLEEETQRRLEHEARTSLELEMLKDQVAKMEQSDLSKQITDPIEGEDISSVVPTPEVDSLTEPGLIPTEDLERVDPKRYNLEEAAKASQFVVVLDH